MMDDETRGMIRGRVQAGRTQVGCRTEGGRRQVGGISLNWALEWGQQSGILESEFKKSGIQIGIT